MVRYEPIDCFGPAKQWEEWTLDTIAAEDGEIAFVTLQAWTGKYLSAKPDGRVEADSDSVGDWEKWQVQPSNSGGFVSLRSHFDKYLVCDDFMNCGNTVRADRGSVQEWEEWVIVRDRDAMTDPGYTANLAIGGTILSVMMIGALMHPPRTIY